jgi:hypothetical protein
MTSTALAASKPQITQNEFQMILQLAPTMHAARLFGTKSPEQAAAIMIKGYELGFSLTASFEFIHVIEDKPSLSPKGALAMILNSPLKEKVEIKDEVDATGKPIACTVTMKRKGENPYTVRFSMEDARKAGLVKPNSGWEKYPANMCKWRAVGFCADIVFPDVIGGTKRADEYGADLTPDGDVIEGSWSVGSQQQQSTVSQKPAVTLESLKAAGYTVAQIFEANGNKPPVTPEDYQAVLDQLTTPTGTPLTDDVSFGGVLGNE